MNLREEVYGCLKTGEWRNVTPLNEGILNKLNEAKLHCWSFIKEMGYGRLNGSYDAICARMASYGLDPLLFMLFVANNGVDVWRTETYSLGGGEWSIEVYDLDDEFLCEFVGSNGTQPDYPKDDLWGYLDEWCEQPMLF